MDENLDDTVVVKRRAPAGSADGDAPDGATDVEDTVLVRGQRFGRRRAAPVANPPALVEPPEREARPKGSAYHLKPPADAAPPPVAAAPSQVETGYYRFRLVDKVITLDATTLIGRRPSNPRIASGRMPRLVRVASPAREVSGTHLELRQAGGAVVVTDLRSTNGTVVTIPRRKPRKLRQGESVVVTAGTLVDIGDGNVIEILPMQEEHQ